MSHVYFFVDEPSAWMVHWPTVLWPNVLESYMHVSMLTFIHSGYFYNASLNPLLLRGAPDYNINIVSELTLRSVIGNKLW